jgi:hypothetical protein
MEKLELYIPEANESFLFGVITELNKIFQGGVISVVSCGEKYVFLDLDRQDYIVRLPPHDGFPEIECSIADVRRIIAPYGIEVED